MVSENPDTVLIAADSSQNSKNTVGYRVGAGAEFLLTDHLGVSLDYIYSHYGSIETRAEAIQPNLIDPDNPYNQVHGVHAPEVAVSTQSLMAGVVYHF